MKSALKEVDPHLLLQRSLSRSLEDMASTTNKRYPHSLQVHPKTDEPYLRLPAPNDNIIITPSRVTDVDATIAILNDVRVAMNLSGPPYPYLHEHAVSWIDMQIAEQRKVIEEMDRAAGDFEQTKYFENCPVQCIREVKEGDEEVFIGNVKISRSNFLPVRDKEEANRLQKENSARPVGDPDIEWFFGGKGDSGEYQCQINNLFHRLPRTFTPRKGHHVCCDQSSHGLGSPNDECASHKRDRERRQCRQPSRIREERLHAPRNYRRFRKAGRKQRWSNLFPRRDGMEEGGYGLNMRFPV